MNLKHLISGILAFFASFVASVFGASESFGAAYKAGSVIEKFDYIEDVTFTAEYEAAECPAGKVFVDGAWADCPAGYYCTGSGYSSDGCQKVLCPEGKYCPAGAATGVSCPTDTFPDSDAGSDEVGDCYSGKLPAGMYYDTVTGAFVTGSYTYPGYYPGGKIYSDFRTTDGGIGNGAVPCPVFGDNKMYTDNDTLGKSVNDCKLTVEAGHYAVVDWAAGDVTINQCPGGTYNKKHELTYSYTGKDDCSQCEDGYTSGPGASECVLMAGTLKAGYYWNGKEETKCDAGYYCPGGDTYEGTGVVGRHKCTDGQYCPTGASEAGICPAGSFCMAGIIDVCPTGTGPDYTQYTSDAGASVSGMCYIITTPGTYVASSSGDLVPCVSGSYCPGGDKIYYGSTGGAKTCDDVTDGDLTWYLGTTGLGAGNSTPDFCVAEVDAGKYWDKENKTVVDCPVDTKSSVHNIGYGDEDSCEKCDAGYSTKNQMGAEQCSVVEYNITLNANGGSSATPSICTVETENITLPTPTKTGYTFGGWYQNSDFSGESVSVIAKGECLSDYTLYAKWTANTYTITLDANGGDGGNVSVTATFGESLPDVAIPTRQDFVFKGYYSAQTGGSQYYDMKGEAIKEWDVDADTTLFAQWMAKGSCDPGHYYNTNTGLVEKCPADSYCAGGKWSTDTGETCPIETCPSDYPNSVAGAKEKGQCYANKTGCSCDDLGKCTAANAYSCTYVSKKFNGVVYYSESGDNKCVLAPGANEAEYCVLKKVTCASGNYFTNTENLEEGRCQACTMLDDGSYIYSMAALVPYPSDSVNGATACYKIVDLPCTEPVCPVDGAGACEFDYPHYKSGGGYSFYGIDEVLPGKELAYVCPGASFTCNEGYDKKDSAVIDPTRDDVSAPEELCTPHVYTFTLDANDGSDATVVGKIYEKYKDGWYSDAGTTDTIDKVAVPERNCYTFEGYYTTKTALEGGVEAVDETGKIVGSPDIVADTTLYAWWTEKTYNITYKGPEDSPIRVTVGCDSETSLLKNTFTYPDNNKKFIGWATSFGKHTAEFQPGDIVKRSSFGEGTDGIVLYPVWEDCEKCMPSGATCTLTAPEGVCKYTSACAANYENLQNADKSNPTCSAIKYAVNMETNGGTISSDYTKVSQCTVESDVIVLPTAAQISREDHRFEGWYDNNNFAGSVITSIPAGECTANKTLYAKWVINVEVCQPGMYYNGTSSVTCPKGYYCPGEGKVTMGVAGCRTECPSGYDDGGTGYSDESQCLISVPQGSYLATAKGTNLTVCPAGKYTADAILVAYGDTSECSSCEAGNYCDGGTKYSCATETDGVFASSAANSDNINDCYTVTVAGKYIAGNAVKTCVVPYYCPGDIKVSYGNSGGNLSCADLSDDVTWQSDVTASGASTPDKCYVQVEAGHYWNGSAFAECKAGTYKTEHKVYYGQKSSCATCPAGYTSEAGASECYLTTTAGKYVATAGKGEVECKAGGFCPGGVKVMVSGVGGREACPSGYANSESGASVSDQCFADCAMYPNAVQMAGRDYYGKGVDTCEATQCETGFVLANGLCGSCPANSVCDPNYDGGKPHTCNELTGGKYPLSVENSASINDCYTMTKEGMYVAVAGQGEVNCRVGDYCLGNVKVMYTGTGGNSACTTLGAGYSSDIGASAETQCYQRCAMAENATAMSGRDYYGSDTGDTCAVASCKAGYTVAGGQCVPCPEDHVCNPAKDNGKPYSCAELTNNVYIRSAAGNSSIDNCYLMTTKGNYVAVAGEGEITCAKNGYCVGGTKVMRAGTGGREACPSGYAKSDAGALEAEQCYTTCAMGQNAYAMSGRDYYADGEDTCEITLCRAGYTLNDGMCELCPANNVCVPTVDSGKPKLCSDLTRGTHRFSVAGSDDVADCYLECEAYDIVYGTAMPVSDIEHYQDVCRYYGVSVTGNPCDIIDGKCVEKACNYNFEMVNGKCQACARENALSYKQDGGNCVVESCVSGFHPNGQSCEADTEECVIPNAISAERVWDSAKQAFGECMVTECAEGYHLGANTCQADEQVCELEHGIGIREWNHKKNTWGDCIATKCDPGYTNDRSQTNELWKQCGRCNNMYSAGGELAASSYVDGCEIAACMYEGELYTLENNECVLICDTYSDETGSRKWNASRKKCERTCEPGYMSW